MKNDISATSVFKQMAVSMVVLTGYFMTLFLIGYMATLCLSWPLVHLFESTDPIKIITWTGLAVISTLALTDMTMVFSKKVSLGIVVMYIPYILFLLAKSAANQTSKSAIVSAKEIARSVVYNDARSKYDIRSSTDAITGLFLNRRHEM
ncbi:hypothetical protein MsAg5_01400 [Methanosarcinaceae archaeon Ag5]|uniref:Uncharacterized protein n=1 Tax=Methanolapillus africanus TaxID=3028297 RepID=A0AAE4MGR4_9EURY|nr:hypothetical protein [Methanosarcinaceae archaeon Ag5]